jgi:hypothetical protein
MASVHYKLHEYRKINLQLKRRTRAQTKTRTLMHRHTDTHMETEDTLQIYVLLLRKEIYIKM